jgi:O-antigen ligase
MPKAKTSFGSQHSLSAALCVFAAAVPLSIAGANIGWAMALAALLFLHFSGQPIPWAKHNSTVGKALIFFIAAAILSSALGVSPSHSFRYFNQDLHKLWLYFLFSWALYAHMRADHNGRSELYVVGAAAAGFAIASAVGIWQVLISLDAPLELQARAHAFVHPATYGEQMCLGLIGAISFAFAPPAGKNATLVRRLALAAAFLTGAALLLSNTRGALLAFFAAFIAMGFLIRSVRRYLVWIIFSAFVGIALMELFRVDRSLFAEIMRWNSPDSHRGQFMRLHLWSAAWQMGVDNFWTGVGHNNFREVFPQYAQLMMEDKTTTWGTAHNLYLHHFAERGIIGLTALCGFLGALWVRAFSRVRKNADAFNLWAFGATTAFLIMNLTEVAFQVEILWMLLFFIWVWAEIRHNGLSKEDLYG